MSNFKFNNNGILAIWNRVLTLLKSITGDVDVQGKGTIQDQLDYLYTHDSSHKTVTTQEFEALTEEEKNDGTIYFITDASGNSNANDGSIPLLDGADPNNILDVAVCRMINATGSIPFVAPEDADPGVNYNDFILQTHWYKDFDNESDQKATQLAFSLIDATIKNRVFTGTVWTDWSAGMGAVEAVQARNFFVGTQAEFDEAYDAGKLDVGAIVILTDQDEEYIEDVGTVVVDGSLSTTSENPIKNKPVAIKFGEVDAEIAALKNAAGVTTTSATNVTLEGKQAVDATQLNANIDGTIANQLSTLKTDTATRFGNLQLRYFVKQNVQFENGAVVLQDNLTQVGIRWVHGILITLSATNKTASASIISASDMSNFKYRVTMNNETTYNGTQNLEVIIFGTETL